MDDLVSLGDSSSRQLSRYGFVRRVPNIPPPRVFLIGLQEQAQADNQEFLAEAGEPSPPPLRLV